MQEKTQLYVDKNTPNVDKNSLNVDKKHPKKTHNYEKHNPL